MQTRRDNHQANGNKYCAPTVRENAERTVIADVQDHQVLVSVGDRDVSIAVTFAPWIDGDELRAAIADAFREVEHSHAIAPGLAADPDATLIADGSGAADAEEDGNAHARGVLAQLRAAEDDDALGEELRARIEARRAELAAELAEADEEGSA